MSPATEDQTGREVDCCEGKSFTDTNMPFEVFSIFDMRFIDVACEVVPLSSD
jgi:hypothetical protein